MERTRSSRELWMYRLASIVVVALLWELFGRTAGGLLLAPFSKTVAAAVELAVSGRLLEPFWLSNQAMVLGFFLAVFVGIPLGLLAATVRRAERFLDVYLTILLVTPMAALIPLFVMMLGFGLASRLLVVVMFVLPIVVVNTRAGVRSIDPSLIEMARCYGVNKWQLWRKVMLPGAIVGILAGIRLGLGRAMTGMVVVELLLINIGIGKLIQEFQSMFEPDYLMATIGFVLLEAVILIELMKRLEHRVSAWVPDSHA